MVLSFRIDLVSVMYVMFLATTDAGGRLMALEVVRDIPAIRGTWSY